MSRTRSPDALIQGPFCPLLTASQIQRRMSSGKYRMTSLGIEKHCARCARMGFEQVYWPLDTEFWFTNATRDGLFSWCRACYMENRWPERYGLAPAKVAA